MTTIAQARTALTEIPADVANANTVQDACARLREALQWHDRYNANMPEAHRVAEDAPAPKAVADPVRGLEAWISHARGRASA